MAKQTRKPAQGLLAISSTGRESPAQEIRRKERLRKVHSAYSALYQGTWKRYRHLSWAELQAELEEIHTWMQNTPSRKRKQLNEFRIRKKALEDISAYKKGQEENENRSIPELKKILAIIGKQIEELPPNEKRQRERWRLFRMAVRKLLKQKIGLTAETRQLKFGQPAQLQFKFSEETKPRKKPSRQ
jgi:hypothetical protein